MKRELRSEFIRYLVPSVASLVGLSLYILADTFFVSVGVGSTGLAALNIVLPAYSVINAMGLMIGIGGGVVCAISRGAGDTRDAGRAFQTALALAAVTGLALTALGIALTRPITELLGASELSVELSVTYLRTLCSFALFFVLNATLTALVRNDGNPKLAMAAMLAGSMANVVLDALFILVFDWGMWGAAFATGLSPIIGLCILSLHWIRGRNTLTLERRVPDFRLIPKIIRGGVSNGIIELGSGLVIFIFNLILMGLGGDIAVAAYGIVANISLVIGYVFIGVGQGIQPVVSYHWGNGDKQSCRSVLRMALLLSCSLGAAFFLAGQLFPHQLAAIFNSEGNAYLQEMTVNAIRIYFFSFLFMGASIVCSSYFQAVLQSRAAATISLLRGFVLVVVGALTLPGMLGVSGVWLIMPAAELVTALVCAAILMQMTPLQRLSR